MFEGNPTEIEGFQLPYDGPLFLTILAIHVIAGLTCVISGVVAMLSRKQKGVHTKSGTVYFAGMCIVFITATLIAIERWKEDYHLFLLGLVSFGATLTGRTASRKKWKKWSLWHVTGMSISYIFLLIAFYIDNGKFLPVWKDLPHFIYWLLPLLIGIPLLVRTLLRNPMTRDYLRKN